MTTTTAAAPTPVSSPWARRLSVLVASAAPSVIALLAAILIFGLFCLTQGASPFAVFASINKAAFGSWYSWQNTLVRAAPILLAALCTALPARTGLYVIGNEGALVFGGLGAVLAGLATNTLSPAISIVLMVIAGALAGGFWIMAAGALHHYRGVNATILTLLMNYVAIAVLDHVVEGPLRDPASLNKPSSRPLVDSHMLANFAGTNVHPGIVIGIVCCLLAWWLFTRTPFGFASSVVGGNPRAAALSGLPVGRIVLTATFLGGAAAGLAGMIEVAAVHGRANDSLHVGYGYAGFLVSFVARHHPLGLIPVSLLLGGLLASGGILQRTHHLSDATILVFQGIVFLCILFSESLRGRLPGFRLAVTKS